MTTTSEEGTSTSELRSATDQRGLIPLLVENVVRRSAATPVVTVLTALGLVVLGVAAFQTLRRDVFPDLSAPVFNVIVQNASMGAEELEASIAIPVESALAGLPGTKRIRSLQQLGVSQITIEFEPDTDYFRARQLVAERVQQVATTLPPGTEPPLLSSLTGRLNEIMELSLDGEVGKVDLMSLRDFADFELRNRLLAVPGVGAVERLGGYLRQFQVQIDPDKLIARGATLEDVMHAAQGANVNVSGGFVVQGPMEWNVRAIGRVSSVDDLRLTVVGTKGGTPVLLGDVADVREGPAIRRGVAHRLNGEIVSVRIVKQFGADTMSVSAGVRAALAELENSLPVGSNLTISYDQAELVESSLSGVARAVLIGAVLVVLVLVALLGNLRAALLVTLTIPASVAIACLLLKRLEVGINTMTLGGLAIAVGLLVDASIIVVENVVHRMDRRLSIAENRARAIDAAVDVGRPIAFATMIVVAVFLPLLSMSGIEGRMYGPLAAAVIASMVAALFLALTITPVMSGLLLARAPVSGSSSATHDDVWIVRALKRAYAPALAFATRHAGAVRFISLALTIPAIALGTQLGTDFMPELDEGALIINTSVPGEASLEQTDLLNHKIEDILRTFPEVVDVVRRTGRSERTEDPMAHTYSDILVVLKKDRERTNDELVTAMRESVQDVPGITAMFTTPLGMRIDEGLGGTPADISLKIFGQDPVLLERSAQQVAAVMGKIAGVEDMRVEQLTGLPQLRVTMDRAAIARVGLTPGDVARALRVGLVGEVVSEVWRGQRHFDLVVRFDDHVRGDPAAIRRLLVDGHDGTRVPLDQLANIEPVFGPGAIRREAGSRRVAVEASVAGRDLGSVAKEIRSRVAKIDLPSGYFFDVGGRVESQASATRSLLFACGVAALLVFVLLYLALGSIADTLVILATLPDAVVGGIAALWIAGQTWNVSSFVGLIGLFGIAVQNGLVLVTQTRSLIAEGRPFDDALREACIGRVRPKVMTAATAILGLLPLLVLNLHGTEVERPLAIVMIGGLLTSTVFTLLALPTFYSWVHHARERRRGSVSVATI